MKKKSFDNAGFSPLKRSLAGKCLAYLGGISIIRPMVAMLLITVLLMSATATKAQIKIPGEVGKFVKIGAKVLSMTGNPYAKAIGGMAGILFAEESAPDYKELKASLEKEWLQDISDKSKEDYKTFINARKQGYKLSLAKIKLAEDTSLSKALDEAQILSGIVYTDIPLYYQNKGGTPYPAGPTLPYLFAAMNLDLGLLKMQIEWEQQSLNQADAAGDAKGRTEARERRDTSVKQYNKEYVEFWKILQSESSRAKKERADQVQCLTAFPFGTGVSYTVRDLYDGRADNPSSLRYYKFLYDSGERGYDDGFSKNDITVAKYGGVYKKICSDAQRWARSQISAETNNYDLTIGKGIYKTTFDKRTPLEYSCTEKIKKAFLIGRVSIADGTRKSLHLFCPVPGGGVDEEGEMASNEILELSEEYARGGYPPKGLPIIRNEDGSIGLRFGVPDMDSQTVTNTNDSGPGSLRQAIEDGGRINIDAIQGQTVTLTSGPLYIYARDVKIMADNLKKPIKIVGQRGDKIFVISGDTKFYNDHGTNLYNLLDVNGKDLKCGVNPSVRENAPPVTTCPGVGQ